MQKNAVYNAIAYTIAIIANILAIWLPLNGKTTGELSDLYPNLFVPAGITFSIWGVIYLLLLGFVINGFFKSINENSEVHKRIGWFFVINCLLNASWIFAWHYLQVELSLLIMFGLLATLILIYQRLGIGRSHEATLREKWLVLTPFSIYLGWISVATIANVTALLVLKGWDGFGISPVLWTQIMIGVATLLAITMVIRRYAIGYAFVVIWALYGIWLKRNHNMGDNFEPDIDITALVCIGLIFLVILWRLLTRKKDA